MTHSIKMSRYMATLDERKRNAYCRLFEYDAFGKNESLRAQWQIILQRISARSAQCVKLENQQKKKKKQQVKPSDKTGWVSMADAMPDYLKVLQQRMGEGNG